MSKSSNKKMAAKKSTAPAVTQKKPANINKAVEAPAPATKTEEAPKAAQTAAKKAPAKAAVVKEEAKATVKAEPKKEQAKTESKKEETTSTVLMQEEPKAMKAPAKAEEKKEEKAAPAKEEPAAEAMAPAKKTAAQKSATKTVTKKSGAKTTKAAAKPAAKEEPKTEETKAPAPAAKEVKAPAIKPSKSAEKPAVDEEQEYAGRFNKAIDELKWLYMELYNDQYHLDELLHNVYEIYKFRAGYLKERDRAAEKEASWYRKSDVLGMQVYTDLFAGNLEGLSQKLDYFKELNINLLHLMPLMKTPAVKNDEGFTVSDFRAVREDLGTAEQLEKLAADAWEQGISICLDFDVNHTSAEHEWAQRAMQGDEAYASRYLNHWDLNYYNPIVFNEMAYNLLYLANLGVNAIQLHDLNLLNTSTHSFPKVHSLTRMFRLLCDIVCPGVLLLCTTGIDPKGAISFLGTEEKPECHTIYNNVNTACIWNSLATRDVRLLNGQLNSLRNGVTYINSARSYDPIRWELDEGPLEWMGFDPYLHTRFLFEFYNGSFDGSFAKGAAYHGYEDDGSCGTAASLCGIEKALEENDARELDLSIKRDILVHACTLTLPGIPMLYSGDEIAQLNDYSRVEQDPRLIHRSAFNWEKAAKRTDKESVQGKVFSAIQNMEALRAKYPVFGVDAASRTMETGDTAVLAYQRSLDGNKLTAVFNFCEDHKSVYIEDGIYTDLLTGAKVRDGKVNLEPYQVMWLYQGI